MVADRRTEARYVLRKTLTLYGRDLALRHPWVSESDRWKELVFALLVQVSSSPEDRVRQLVGHLADLDLLEIPALASVCAEGGQPKLDAPPARQMLDLLQETGFSRDAAERGVTAVCQAALAFQKSYEGKVQRYLRSYGDLMLGDLGRIFQLSSLTEGEVRDAFTYWLQNIMNMPISLADESLREYCEAHHLTPDQLAAAADDLDLNLAVVDDLTALWASTRREAEAD